MLQRFTAFRTPGLLALSLTLLCLVALSLPGAPALAQACTPDIKEAPVVPADSPQLHVAMKWCGVVGAPSVDDPSLVGEDNYKDMLWRRHERASECIFIPQCRITLRSGGAVQHEDYPTIVDPDQGTGDAADVVIRNDEGDADYSELIELFDICDEAWEDQPKGMIAVSIDRFLDFDGNEIGVHGVALSASSGRPALAVIDPTETNADNERVLAHEAGHKIGLCHTNAEVCSTELLPGDPDNLMRSNVPNGLLLEDQCDAARSVVAASTQLDPPPDPDTLLGLVDHVRDSIGEFPNQPGLGFLDLFKIVGVDDTMKGEDLVFTLATNGGAGPGAFALYSLALDTDNDASTGLPAHPRLQGSTMTGVDLLLTVSMVGGEAGDARAFVPVAGSFQEVATDGLTGLVRDVRASEVGPDAFEDETSLFLEVEMRIAPEALPSLGLPPAGETLFPNALRLQAASFAQEGDGGEFVDLGPDAAAELDFPEIRFPGAVVVGSPCAGGTVQVEVEGLPAEEPLKVFLGDAELPIDQLTDENGEATFSIAIPAGLAPGPTLLTVGVDNPHNALTADLIIDICLVPEERFRFEYAAKVVCGVQPEPAGTRLARGLYATAVNIRNPGPRQARFAKELALAFPPGDQRPGEVLPISFDELGPRQALAIDCPDLERRLFRGGFPASYIDGFVVIRSITPLDVTAVYSTATLNAEGSGEDQASVHVEVVPEREIRPVGGPGPNQ